MWGEDPGSRSNLSSNSDNSSFKVFWFDNKSNCSPHRHTQLYYSYKKIFWIKSTYIFTPFSIFKNFPRIFAFICQIITAFQIPVAMLCLCLNHNVLFLSSLFTSNGCHTFSIVRNFHLFSICTLFTANQLTL